MPLGDIRSFLPDEFFDLPAPPPPEPERPKRGAMDIIGALFEALATGVGTATGNRDLVAIGQRGRVQRDKAEALRTRREQQVEDQQTRRTQALQDQARQTNLQETRRSEDQQRTVDLAVLQRSLEQGTNPSDELLVRLGINPLDASGARDRTPQETVQDQLVAQLGLRESPLGKKLKEFEFSDIQRESDITQRRQLALGAQREHIAERAKDKPITETGLENIEKKSTASRRGALIAERGRAPKPLTPTTLEKNFKKIQGVSIAIRSRGFPRFAQTIDDTFSRLASSGGTQAEFLELRQLALQMFTDPDLAPLISQKIAGIGRLPEQIAER